MGRVVQGRTDVEQDLRTHITVSCSWATGQRAAVPMPVAAVSPGRLSVQALSVAMLVQTPPLPRHTHNVCHDPLLLQSVCLRRRSSVCG